MPNEIEEDEIDLPKWWLQIKKAAGELFAGCLTSEILIRFAVIHILKPAITDIIEMLIVPFGLLCCALSGFKGLDIVHRALELIKKIKEDGK